MLPSSIFYLFVVSLSVVSRIVSRENEGLASTLGEHIQQRASYAACTALVRNAGRRLHDPRTNALTFGFALLTDARTTSLKSGSAPAASFWSVVEHQ